MADKKNFYWLKLKEDFFNQLGMKKLRKIAGGDTYTIIYLKMQLLALKTEGVISFEKTSSSYEFDNFIEDLAILIDEEELNVKTTIGFCITNKLIESLSENELFIPSVLESTGKEGASAERVRKFRESQKQEKLLLQCNANVTKCNTEIEKEKEINIEIKKEINIEVEEEVNKKIVNITKTYEQEIGILTPATAEKLFDYLNDFNDYEIIIEAIKRASYNNKRHPNYIFAILKSWSNSGYKVLIDLEKDTKEYKKENERDTRLDEL